MKVSNVLAAYAAGAEATGLELATETTSRGDIGYARDAKGGSSSQVLREKVGIAYTTRRMVDNGWELMDADLHYAGNHGLDLAFKQGPEDSLRYAVAEAKYSRSLGALAHDVQGLRQGSWDYIEDRLRLLGQRDAAGLQTARELLGAQARGDLQSFGSFYRGDKLYELNYRQRQILLANGNPGFERYRFLNGVGARLQ
jgi:hypothetical protein